MSTSYKTAMDLAEQHARTGLILDTNLLLLYLVGTVFPERIGSDRLSKYDQANFVELKAYVGFFSNKFVTQAILSEVWNWLETMFHGEVFAIIAQHTKKEFKIYKEHHSPKDEILNNRDFIRLGVSDTSIIEAARAHRLLVVTDDLPAANCCRQQDVPVVNLSHILFDC